MKTEYEIIIGPQKVNSQKLNVELIPNPDGIQPVDWCQTCGRESVTLFWNGKQTICVECDKGRHIHKKLNIPMLDEGISLVEFFARLQSRNSAFE